MPAAPVVSLSALSASVTVPADDGAVRTTLDAILTAGRRKTATRQILTSVSGSIRPGSMTLVLGAPGCGKTTLLKAVAQQSASGVTVSGSATYDGLSPAQFDPSRVLSYVEQADNLLPTLTVKETLEVSHTFQGGAGPAPDTVLSELGLVNCQDTIIGGMLLRGVSGGEKRRVTLGEMLVGPQLGFCLDEVTTGLDSATAANIFTYLRGRCDAERLWIVAALLQPPPELFELFDDVLVLSGGAVAYHGPRSGLQQYLADIGAPLPEGRDLADWVQDVVSGSHHAHDDEEAGAAPLDLPQLWAARSKGKDVQAPKTAGKPDWLAERGQRLSWLASTRLIFWRQWVLLFRNKPLFFGRLQNSIGNSLFVGSLFWDIGFDEFQSKMGAIFFVLMTIAMGTMIAVPIAVLYRNTLTKQRRAKFFDLTSYLVGDALSGLPLLAAEVVVYSAIVYHMCSFTESDGHSHFFMFMLLVWIANVATAEFFKLTVGLSPSASIALPICGLTIIGFVLQSGVIATKDAIPDAWIWLYHVSPVSWAVRGLAMNEFDSSEYSDALVTRADGTVEEAGQMFLSAYSMDGYAKDYVWTCVLVLAAEVVAFMALNWLVLTYVHWDNQARGTTESSASSGSGSGGRSTPPLSVEMAAVSSRQVIPAEQSPSSPAAARSGATFAFKDINYWVSTKKQGELHLLTDVSGFCEPGKITALMGQSGAGKSTLLDVVAGRKTQGRIAGEMLVNGHPKDAASFGRIAAYVEQEDVHTKTDTVREALEFSAALRLSASSAGKQARAIDETLRMLELDRLADRVVGSLSHGQLKRLTIAVELVADPAIVFLDEPTSGLDARAAFNVMRCVRRIADSGRTVCLTVHQPSMQLVNMFDDLILLQRGGRMAYCGPFEGVVPYLEALPGASPMAPGVNPSDYMLDTVGATEADLSEVYAGSETEAAAAVRLAEASVRKLKLEPSAAAGQLCQQKAVLARTARTYWRTPSHGLVRTMMMVGVGFVFGTTMLGSDYDTVNVLISYSTVTFMTLLFSAWCALVLVQAATAPARAVFYREKPNGMYHPAHMVFSIALVELPYLIVATLGMALVFYPCLWDFELEGFLWFYVFFFLTFNLANVVGIFTIFTLPNEIIAQLASVAIVTMWALFAGIMQPSDTMGAWKFMYYASPIHYAVEGILMTQFHGDTTPVLTLLGGHAPAGAIMEDALYSDFDYDNRYLDLLVLVGITLMFQAGTFWGAARVNWNRR